MALWFPLEFVVVNQKTITKIIESESNLVFFSSDFWYDLQKGLVAVERWRRFVKFNTESKTKESREAMN